LDFRCLYNFWGVATLFQTLIELKNKGIKGKVLASQYLNFTHPEALKKLLNFDNIELRIATKTDFHSKGYLFENGGISNLIIGSSNWTQTALTVNKEWNLKVSGTVDSELIQSVRNEFQNVFDNSITVDEKYIDWYSEIYNTKRKLDIELNRNTLVGSASDIQPNKMQREALLNIGRLRDEGKEKALLISATGTGKTYLSAFDVRNFKPKKFLFVVHRQTIAQEAKETFERLLGSDISMGLYSGSNKDLDADYLFSTIQTISQREHLEKFDRSYFDYIVIDETHRAGASSYRRLMNYFKPKFLLGMTATPERTDGEDVFELFDHNIAYEIRLHRALEEKMLCPFHYYGVSDVTVNDEELSDKSDFNLLTATERVNRIIETAKLYNCDSGQVRGLIFCSRKAECITLSKRFNELGYRTIALVGESSNDKRIEAIDRLESDDINKRLDYIFTVDIFNEGIDIPKVNQIIMLRPTQSAIIFVQQLGRGLRKNEEKDYLTVIDFIGNYDNNYMVPIALFGDTTYNKDSLRKLMASGSRLMPGTSTINFDRIAKERIFNSIDNANLNKKTDLDKDFDLLKFKLGRIPMMMDFIISNSRDPLHYEEYSKSYYNYVLSKEKDIINPIGVKGRELLKFLSLEVNNAKRVEESYILNELIKNRSIDLASLKKSFFNEYEYQLRDEVIFSALNNINLLFVTEKKNGALVPVGESNNLKIVDIQDDKIFLVDDFLKELTNPTFKFFLQDSILTALNKFDNKFIAKDFQEGFILYNKYSRKDVFRILNWIKNPVAQNVGGYMISPDNTNCALFVNYHKKEDISSTTKYEDEFLNPDEFQWMSKSKRNLKNKDVVAISKGDLRLPLFIKKSNDEGIDFYYMGDLTTIQSRIDLKVMKNDSGKDVSVVKFVFNMNTPVRDEMYEYIISN